MNSPLRGMRSRCSLAGLKPAAAWLLQQREEFYTIVAAAA